MVVAMFDLRDQIAAWDTDSCTPSTARCPLHGANSPVNENIALCAYGRHSGISPRQLSQMLSYFGGVCAPLTAPHPQPVRQDDPLQSFLCTDSRDNCFQWNGTAFTKTTPDVLAMCEKLDQHMYSPMAEHWNDDYDGLQLCNFIAAYIRQFIASSSWEAILPEAHWDHIDQHWVFNTAPDTAEVYIIPLWELVYAYADLLFIPQVLNGDVTPTTFFDEFTGNIMAQKDNVSYIYTTKNGWVDTSSVPLSSLKILPYSKVAGSGVTLSYAAVDTIKASANELKLFLLRARQLTSSNTSVMPQLANMPESVPLNIEIGSSCWLPDAECLLPANPKLPERFPQISELHVGVPLGLRIKTSALEVAKVLAAVGLRGVRWVDNVVDVAEHIVQQAECAEWAVDFSRILCIGSGTEKVVISYVHGRGWIRVPTPGIPCLQRILINGVSDVYVYVYSSAPILCTGAELYYMLQTYVTLTDMLTLSGIVPYGAGRGYVQIHGCDKFKQVWRGMRASDDWSTQHMGQRRAL